MSFRRGFVKALVVCLTGGEIVDLDLSVISTSMPFLLEGLLMTLELTTISVLIGIVIGSLAGIARVSKSKDSEVYCDGVHRLHSRDPTSGRQIFLIYFGIPGLIGRPVPSTVAALVALSINSGAYVAEIVRAGIQSIDKGQEEAARSPGTVLCTVHEVHNISTGVQEDNTSPGKRVHRIAQGLFSGVSHLNGRAFAQRPDNNNQNFQTI